MIEVLSTHFGRDIALPTFCSYPTFHHIEDVHVVPRAQASVLDTCNMTHNNTNMARSIQSGTREVVCCYYIRIVLDKKTLENKHLSPPTPHMTRMTRKKVEW
jgi:hypothetical protein